MQKTQINNVFLHRKTQHLPPPKMNQGKETFGKLISDITSELNQKLLKAENSPYQLMIQQVKRIDNDYFENIPRDVEYLAPELNLELKERVKANFNTRADQLLDQTPLMMRLMSFIRMRAQAAKPLLGTETVLLGIKSAIDQIKAGLRLQMGDAKKPAITEQELEKKFHDAQNQTVVEWVMQNNKNDVIDFYHALLETTVWECRCVIEERMSRFLNQLQQRVNEDSDIQYEVSPLMWPSDIEARVRQTEIRQPAAYMPRPIDTSEIDLPEDLGGLVEQMARNVHEVWAQGRMQQGWTYGQQRDDQNKKHPCLVPYEQLPEDEKTFDRNTAIGTLKLILKLGFKIRRN